MAPRQELLRQVLDEIEPEASSLRQANEADTRIGVIDRILTVMGWPTDEVKRERSSGTGEFLDYELLVASEPWMVVEAKRADVTFHLDSYQREGKQETIRSISTLLKRDGGKALRSVMAQAATYCNDRGVPLACVTNGYQWVFFRGLSSVKRPWTTGAAFVFDRPSELLSRFPEFEQCFSRDHAHGVELLRRLDRKRNFRPRQAETPSTKLSTTTPTFGSDTVGVRAICDLLFGDIESSDRAKMLERCYVEPGNKGDFERSVSRLLKDSAHWMKEDVELIQDSDPRTFVDHVKQRDAMGNMRDPVVVAGHVGAGKTTFIARALQNIRKSGDAIFARIDLEGHGVETWGDSQSEQARVADRIIDSLGKATYTMLKRNRPDISDAARVEADPHDLQTLRTLFRDPLSKRRKMGAAVFSADEARWNQEELQCLREYTDDKISYLVRYIRHIRARFVQIDRTKYPILIVLDNLDTATDEFQRRIYTLAHRLARETPATVVVCLREATFARGRQQGGFLTSSQLPFVFHVAAPPFDHVLRQRVRFARTPIFHEMRQSKRLSELGQEFESVLAIVDQSLLPQRSKACELIAGLSGQNIREGLGLTSAMILGSKVHGGVPSPTAEYVFESILAARDIDTLGRSIPLVNCFVASPATVPAHQLRIRLLAYFSWARDENASRPQAEMTDAAIARFSGWGYSAGEVHDAIKALYEGRLLRPWDRGEAIAAVEAAQQLPDRLSLTPAGGMHLRTLVRLPAYRAAMAMRVGWYDLEKEALFVEMAAKAGGEAGPTVADIVVSAALAVFDAYLAVAFVREDAQLAPQYHNVHSWALNVLSMCADLVPTGFESVLDLTSSAELAAKAKTSGQTRQGELFAVEASQLPDASEARLPVLGRDTRYAGSVWIPRILWALEFARLRGDGGVTAAEISRLLTEYGEIDVPGTNVSRAFRDFKTRSDASTDGLWEKRGHRVSITPAGSALLKAIADAAVG